MFGMAEWSHELVMEFLKLYQAEPVIYDPNHPNHNNKMTIKSSWNKIKQGLSADLPLEEIKRKKDSLMASFRHHLRRKKASIKSGSREIYQPCWYAYATMESFMGTIYDCDPAHTENATDEKDYEEYINIKEEELSCYHDPLEYAPAQRAVTTSTASKSISQSRKRPLELPHMNDQSYDSFENQSNKEDDECDLYGKLIAKKLRKLSESSRDQFMYEIDGLFLKAKKNQSSGDSSSATPLQISLKGSPVRTSEDQLNEELLVHSQRNNEIT